MEESFSQSIVRGLIKGTYWLALCKNCGHVHQNSSKSMVIDVIGVTWELSSTTRIVNIVVS